MTSQDFPGISTTFFVFYLSYIYFYFFLTFTSLVTFFSVLTMLILFTGGFSLLENIKAVHLAEVDNWSLLLLWGIMMSTADAAAGD